MADHHILADATEVGAAAARAAVRALERALEDFGTASWVLAGGSSPAAAYRTIVREFPDAMKWSQVTFLIGDERCVPEDHSDSNWRQAREELLDPLAVPEASRLRPDGSVDAEAAADDYERQIAHLAGTPRGVPRLDHVWLGVGEDGHTLSLFPGHPRASDRDRLVLAVHDSPKPPPDRITLSLKALEGTRSCIVLAAGAGKADAIGRVFRGESALPIAMATATIEAAGGTVEWLLDESAAARM